MAMSPSHPYTVNPINIVSAGQSISGPRDIYISDGMTLTIKHANGGWVVQLHKFNEQPLYVIHDEADLASELGKIITMNCLKD